MLRGVSLLLTSWAIQQFRGDEPLDLPGEGREDGKEGAAVESLPEHHLNGRRPGAYGAHDWVPPAHWEPDDPPQGHREVHPHGFSSFAERAQRRKISAVQKSAKTLAANKKEREAIRAYAHILQKAAAEDKRSGTQSKMFGWILDIMMDMAGAMLSTKQVVPGDYPYMCICAAPTMNYETGEMIPVKENDPICPTDMWAMDCYERRQHREATKNLLEKEGAVEEGSDLWDALGGKEMATESGAVQAYGEKFRDMGEGSLTTAAPRSLISMTAKEDDGLIELDAKTLTRFPILKTMSPHTLMERAKNYVAASLGTNAFPQLKMVTLDPSKKEHSKHEIEAVIKENRAREHSELVRLEEMMATPMSTKLTRTVVVVFSFVCKIAIFGMFLLGTTLVLKKRKKAETKSQQKERLEPGSTQ